MAQPMQVKAIWHRDGFSMAQVVVGGRVYQQDMQLDPLCVPAPPDATCAICGATGCECPGEAHEPAELALEYEHGRWFDISDVEF